MSERFKAKYFHLTDYGTTVELTCHFKFEKALWPQKFDPDLGGGKPICNGCGPSGYGAMVPDRILGVCVTIAGHIHNWSYQFGKDREDKMVADETFGDNMDRLIRDHYEMQVLKIMGGSLVKPRLWLARRKFNAQLDLAEDAYEKAVKVFGKSAFWDKRVIGFTLEDVGR